MKTHRSKATAIPCPHPGPRHTAWLVSAILCWVAAPPVHAQISELSYAITNGTIIITAHPGTNENVTIPSTVNGLPVVAIGDGAFYDDNAKNVTISAGVTSIGRQAFASSHLSSIAIPNTVTNIGDYAFEFTGLTTFYVHASVTVLGTGVFYHCLGLTAITVDLSNPAYSSLDGVLFAANRDVLLQYPPAKSGFTYAIPAGVIHVAPRAFADARFLGSVTLGDTVTDLGNSAFYACGSLTSVTFGTNVSNVGDSAFYNCTQLYNVLLDSSLTNIGYDAFCGCASLLSIVIPDGVTSIGYFAFNGCSRLTSVVLGAGLSNYGNDAFAGCGQLASITVSASNASYSGLDGVLFDKSLATLVQYPPGKPGSYIIPGSVTNLWNTAFNACSGLTAIAMSSNLTIIPGAEFMGCSNLANVTLTPGLTLIGWGAFEDCSKLSSIAIPDGVMGLGAWAFASCTNLTSAVLEGKADVGGYAFCGCVRLTNVVFGTGIGSIDDFAFSGCYQLRSIVLPSALNDIGYYAFSGCSGLTNVVFSNSMISIRDYAFQNCRQLRTITIPDSVLNLGVVAFLGCSGLTSVTIGSGLTNYGGGGFTGCLQLSAINISPSNPFYCSVNGIVFNKDLTWLMGYPAAKAGNYAIPATVTGIACDAFASAALLTGVSIPNGVTNIGDGAFSGCSGLTNILIPPSVSYLGSSALLASSLASVYFQGPTPPTLGQAPNSSSFYGSSNLTIYYPAGNPLWVPALTAVPTNYPNYDYPAFKNAPWYPHYYCTTNNGALTVANATGIAGRVIIPDTLYGLPIVGIGSKAFSGCTNLPSFGIGRNVLAIGDGAFGNCVGLTGVYFRGNAPSLGTNVFAGETNVIVYYPDKGNGWSATFGGVPTVLWYPQFVTTTNNGMITISGNDGASGVEHIPGTINGLPVTAIGYSAFSLCTNLTEITIPNGVTSIG